MSDCWKPADHTYTGDCDGQLVRPHYQTMPDRIRVYDRAVRCFGWSREQKKLWRKARDLGLERWGYPVEVIELRRRAKLQYRAEGITLGMQDVLTYPSSNSYGGFGLDSIEDPASSEYSPVAWALGKGYAMIHPKVVGNALLGRVTGVLAGTIAHEVGHALGFGHGGTGIMESVINPPYYPNEAELAYLEAYWGRA